MVTEHRVRESRALIPCVNKLTDHQGSQRLLNPVLPEPQTLARQEQMFVDRALPNQSE